MPQKPIGGRAARGAKVATIALGAAAAAIVVGLTAPAARAGDDDVAAPPSLYDKFLSTIGLKDPTDVEYEINYSERSPLVVPPTRDLPPPATLRATPAPNWPKDPDTIRKQASKQEDEKPIARPFDSVTESSRPLRPDELKTGRAATAVSAPGVGEQSTPSQLGEPKKSVFSFDWMNKEQYATFTGEPQRANLTDPPPGYLTPSPDQPYGIQPDKKGYKPKTLGERMEPQR
jgi:hypothetical protein